MIAYFLEVTICWAGFYGLYHLLLSRTTFFRANRYYLLGALTLGLLTPSLTLPIPRSDGAAVPVVVAYLEPVSVSVQQLEVSVTGAGGAAGFDHTVWLVYMYLLGVVFLGARALLGLWQLARLYWRGKKERRGAYTLVRTASAHLPFSFFRWLFLSEDLPLDEEERRIVQRHELAHIQGGHSFDVLFLELLCVLFWFSPPVHLFRRSLRHIHEYLADEAVLRTTRRKKYGHILLKQLQSGPAVALANHFVHSQLKKRILMMTKHKSSGSVGLRYLLAIPLALLFMLAFANRELIGQTLVEIHHPNGEVEKRELMDIRELDGLAHPSQIASVDIRKDPDRDRIILVLREGSENAASEDNAAEWAKMSNIISIPIGERVLSGAAESPRIADQISELNQNGKKRVVEIRHQDGRVELLHFNSEDFPTLHEISPDEIVSIEVRRNGDEDRIIVNLGKSGQAKTNALGRGPYFSACPEAGDDVEAQKACADKRLLEFVYKNIKYPASARQAKIQGTVVVKFTVDKYGVAVDPVVVRSVGGGLDEEVLRVVGKMPKWIPAQKNGQPVDAEFTLPVRFKLDETDSQVAMIHVEDNAEVFKIVEEMPRFPGCEDMEGDAAAKKACADQRMLRFVYENIRYPDAARKNKVEGTVVASFIVDEEGRLTNIEAVRDIGDGAGEEVVRVVRLMQEQAGRWTPGRQKGKTVKVQYNLPVRFRLPEEVSQSASAPAGPPAIDRQLALRQFSAAPNPSGGMLRLRFEAEAQPTEVLITDLGGKEVFRANIERFNGYYDREIDLSRAAKGTLLLVVRQQDKVFTEKIVLQ
jgi:TonB family protein